jgi:superfamily II DNA/RNA helicase
MSLEAINARRDGQVHFLFSTDMACLGLDITGITHVISTDAAFGTHSSGFLRNVTNPYLTEVDKIKQQKI